MWCVWWLQSRAYSLEIRHSITSLRNNKTDTISLALIESKHLIPGAQHTSPFAMKSLIKAAKNHQHTIIVTTMNRADTAVERIPRHRNAFYPCDVFLHRTVRVLLCTQSFLQVKQTSFCFRYRIYGECMRSPDRTYAKRLSQCQHRPILPIWSSSEHLTSECIRNRVPKATAQKHAVARSAPIECEINIANETQHTKKHR